MDESLCLKLLDRGAHLIVVSIMGVVAQYDQDLMESLASGASVLEVGSSGGGVGGMGGGNGTSVTFPVISGAGVGGKGASTGASIGGVRGGTAKGGKKGVLDRDDSTSLGAILQVVTKRLEQQSRVDYAGSGRSGGSRRGAPRGSIKGQSDDGKDLIKSIAAATIHNITLRRAVLGPGILSCLLSFTKNCKSLRMLHSVRTMAHVSCHSKSKLALSKEPRLIPALIKAMRSGCEEV